MNEAILENIRHNHRTRRYWMKVQQKLERALEAYVRGNYTDWHPDDSEADRKRESAKALAIIEAAKKGEGSDELVILVGDTMKALEPILVQRKAKEKALEQFAEQLPPWRWVQSVNGFGALGFATIIGLTGDLSNYATVSKVWKRLMLAPYNGFAGSSLKRPSWCDNYKMTKEEWIANPFSGERYSLIVMIAESLHKKQVEGKKKSDTKHGKPKGPYGELYVRRREHTDETHPDWTPMHAKRDAMRYMVKALIRDLWIEWRHATEPDFTNKPWKEAAE